MIGSEGVNFSLVKARSISAANGTIVPYKAMDSDPKGHEFDNINVIVRVRPTANGKLVGQDRTRDPSSLFPAAGQVQVLDPISGQSRSFTFNVVFEPEATQEQVFEHSGIKRLINMALEGFACTVFAYGQTGSGKTFTLTGNVFQHLLQESGHKESNHHNNKETNHNNNEKGAESGKKIVGLIQFAFAYLFEQIKLRKEKGVYYVVTASYLEVYNEHVLDLLNPSPKCLNVRWNKDRGFYAENLFKVECEDIGDLEGVLEEGCRNRSVRSHLMNETSSRAHSLLTISLASETQDPEDPQGYIRREGRLCLVDLAGSEKVKRTKSKGETFIEANNINRSLLVLGNCISALACPKRRAGHIPYRDSTLTKLLADSLSGSGMTLMIACVSPSAQDGSETINTLRYAARAKKVKTNPIVRMDPRELLILSLKREVRLLRMENNYLRQQLNLGSGFILEGGGQDSLRPLSNSSSPSDAESKKNEENQKEDMLHKYMQENEGLRGENSQLHQQRERLIHDHEQVCRENEKLLRRLGSGRELRTPSPHLIPAPDSSESAGSEKGEVTEGTERRETSQQRADGRRPSIMLGTELEELRSDLKDDSGDKRIKAKGRPFRENKLHNGTEQENNQRNGVIKFQGLEIRGRSAATKARIRRK